METINFSQNWKEILWEKPVDVFSMGYDDK